MPEAQRSSCDYCIEVVSGKTVEVISSAVCARQRGNALIEEFVLGRIYHH
jgi:hypothetical protein